MLDEQDTLRYLRAAKNGDASAKETLLVQNVSLIKSIVKRYLGKGVEYDDLFELACMGFLKAIAGFNEAFGVRFSTYAVPMIAGELKRFLRDDGSMKVSRLLKKAARDINIYVERYCAEYGEQPSVKEIATALGVEECDVVFAIGSSRMPVSIYEQSDYKDEKSIRIVDRIPSSESAEQMIDKIFLNEAIARLPEREQKIIILRYYRDMTQSEVARCIGVSQVQISRIESKIIQRFREELSKR